VALAVSAIALAALWKGLSQGVVATQALPDRLVARWVAQNRLVARQARAEWPSTREYRGSATMGGREWYWVEQIETTGEPLLRRITVAVRANEEEPVLFELEGYLSRPRAGQVPSG